MFTYIYEGTEIQIVITRHADERMEERGILLTPVYGAVVAVTDHILDLKSGEEFAILDKDLGVAIIGNIKCAKCDIAVTIFTVVDSANVWVKNGTTVIPLEL